MFRKSFNILMMALVVAFSVGCSDDDDDAVVLQSIQITPAQTSVPVNTTGEYSAIAYYSDNTSADVTQEVTWESDKGGS